MRVMNNKYSEIIINGKILTIYSFFDEEFKADRYYYSIDNNHYSGGYGKNNEIIYPNEITAIISALSHIVDKNDFLKIKRQFLIESIL
jgi:hypothetical protein